MLSLHCDLFIVTYSFFYLLVEDLFIVNLDRFSTIATLDNYVVLTLVMMMMMMMMMMIMSPGDITDTF